MMNDNLYNTLCRYFTPCLLMSFGIFSWLFLFDLPSIKLAFIFAPLIYSCSKIMKKNIIKNNFAIFANINLIN